MREYRVQITFEGSHPIELECREDEDIITAGLRQGLLLLSDCRQGLCGACRGFLEDGHYDILERSPHVLSERDEEDGWTLACRLRPRSDLLLDFEYPADRVVRLDKVHRSGRIVRLERLSPSVVRVVVRTLAAQEPLRWEAGQYVRLHLTQIGVTRSYSIANLTNDERELEFFIGLRAGGLFSNALVNMRGEGTPVMLEGPFGSFTLGAVDHELVFVADGTGLSPILAMLRQMATIAPDRRAKLIFGVNTEDDLFAHLELSTLSATWTGLTTFVTVAKPGSSWTGLSGTVIDALADQLSKANDPQGSHYYFCGPASTVQAVRRLTESFDVSPSAIHQELFVPTKR